MTNHRMRSYPRSVGRDASGAQLIKAERTIQEAGFLLRRALESVDIVIPPTAPQTACGFDTQTPIGQADLMAVANFSGCPAVSPVARGLVVLMAREIMAYEEGRKATARAPRGASRRRTARRGQRPGRGR